MLALAARGLLTETNMMRAVEEVASFAPAVEWAVSDGPVDYLLALDVMKTRVAAIRDGQARELIWLLEHPPLYTAGTSAKDADLLNPGMLPVYRVGRGGQFTYHGPGQRIVYVMLDLKLRGADVRAFVTRLERWVIATLAQFNVKGETRRDRAGVWVKRPSETRFAEDKIAAIGLRVSRWVSSHGISLNVDPDLSHYGGIVPCGIRDAGVTSLADLGLPLTLYDVDVALRASFQQAFGPARLIEPGRTGANSLSHALRKPMD
jgi:lipoyl(octanoyl) transferase